jgi:hypothetical protein
VLDWLEILQVLLGSREILVFMADFSTLNEMVGSAALFLPFFFLFFFFKKKKRSETEAIRDKRKMPFFSISPYHQPFHAIWPGVTEPNLNFLIPSPKTGRRKIHCRSAYHYNCNTVEYIYDGYTQLIKCIRFSLLKKVIGNIGAEVKVL